MVGDSIKTHSCAAGDAVAHFSATYPHLANDAMREVGRCEPIARTFEDAQDVYLAFDVRDPNEVKPYLVGISPDESTYAVIDLVSNYVEIAAKLTKWQRSTGRPRKLTDEERKTPNAAYCRRYRANQKTKTRKRNAKK